MSGRRRALILAALPGAGHIALGRRRVGLELFGLFAFLTAVLVARWEAFRGAWGGPGLDAWIATRVLVLGLVLCVVVSISGVRRILSDAKAEGAWPGEGTRAASMAIRRFRANTLAVGALYAIVLLYLVAVLAPILAPHDPAAIGDVVRTRYLPPSFEHPFGTDEYGRDLLSRALYGARISLSVGLLSVLIAVSFGTLYGAVSGYFGGWIDSLLMRLLDVVVAFPTFFLMLSLVGLFQASLVVLVLVLGLTSWTGTARLVRGEILSLKQREFVESARAIGLPAHTIITRHLIPNALAPVLVSAALMVGGMVGAEAGLSFLGIGIRPPTPSWGNMISQGDDTLFFAWWIALFPGLLLTATILSFNLLADGLRDALDPKTLMRRVV